MIINESKIQDLVQVAKAARQESYRKQEFIANAFENGICPYCEKESVVASTVWYTLVPEKRYKCTCCNATSKKSYSY